MRLSIKGGIGIVLVASMLNAMGGPAGAAGSTWTVVPIPVASSVLYGVSCLSATSCTAVGTTYTNTSTSPPAGITLIERWDGTAWTTMPSPNPPDGGSTHILLAVSCSSATSCTAGGYSGVWRLVNRQATLIATVPVVEHWDGVAWTVVPSPYPSGAQYSKLTGVSCTSASSCTAVGIAQSRTLIEHSDGAGWTIVASPNPEGSSSSSLGAVSCTRANSCTAVGSSTPAANSGTAMTLVERWDGTTWTIVPSPNPPGGTPSYHYNLLSGVSCAAATACTAVGTSENPGNWATLVERWDGRAWTVVPSPNPAGFGQNLLSGVSCTSATACTAVGSSGGKTFPTLVERWDGRAWTILANPTPSGALYGVSCTRAASCVAVGTTTLIENPHTGATTTCLVSGLRVGPPKQEDVTVQNTGGVAAITDVAIVNGTVSVPAFTPGTTSPIVVTATKANPNAITTWSFDVTDSAGHKKHCA